MWSESSTFLFAVWVYLVNRVCTPSSANIAQHPMAPWLQTLVQGYPLL